MVCFQTKNPNLGKFWRALEWKSLVHSLAILNILRPFGTLYGHLVILWQFDIFSHVLVYCVEKNLATLVGMMRSALLPGSKTHIYVALW
jgi:hypothetical protein